MPVPNLPRSCLIEGNCWVVGKVTDDFKSMSQPAGTHFLAFLYVDHQAGLTLDLWKYVNILPNRAIQLTKGPRDEHKRVIIRYDMSKPYPLTVLSADQIEGLGLPGDLPEMQFYRKPEIDPLRKLTVLDPFRAPGFPDDVKIMLLKTERPEQVWGRLERQLKENIFECILLNQPYHAIGLNLNDHIVAKLGIYVRSFQGQSTQENILYCAGLVSNFEG